MKPPETEQQNDEIEVSGEDNPYSNVTCLWTRKPYVPPEMSPREKIVAKEPETSAAEILKSAVVDFEEGNLHGLIAVMGVFDDKGNLVDYRNIISEVACAYPISFLGALEQLKLTVSDMAGSVGEEGAEPDPMDFFDEVFD